MTRLHKTISLMLSLLILLGMLISSATAADRLNVVIIYTDDLGWGDLGCYGHPDFKTPRIDKLAAEGARLTSFYSSCPYCAPSRAALQTGRYQVRSGMTLNPCPDRPGKTDDIGLPASEVTLGEAFKAAGYATTCIGKWHLGHKPEFHPLKHGYDSYLGILYSNDMRPVELWDDNKVIEYPVVQATLTKRYTDRACEFIRTNKDKPFFCYLAHAMPHKPLACSETFYKKTGTGLYGNVIAEIDWSVGQVMDTLREMGLDQNTLVWFASDNGPWYGGSTGGLRGMKGRTWEGGIRVPLIARWPGKIPAGHTSDAPAIIMDLFTTSLTAAGITLPSDRVIDGKDILPVLTSDAVSPHDVLFSFASESLRTVRVGKWKLHIRVPQNPKETLMRPDEKWVDWRAPDGVTILAPYEQAHPSQYPGMFTGDTLARGQLGLFDLSTDPSEQHNVAEAHPDVVQRLKALADGFE